MNWDAIGAVGEIVGAGAVVASLLYLSIQTKASAKAMRINAIYDAETAFASVNYNQSLDPRFADIASKAFQPDARSEDFTATELNQLHFAVRGCLQHMQAQWSLWREGYLSAEFWERRRRWTYEFVSLPVIKPMWDAEVGQFLISPEFMSDIETASDATERASLKIGGAS
jgi:hypothetical protein